MVKLHQITPQKFPLKDWESDFSAASRNACENPPAPTKAPNIWTKFGQHWLWDQSKSQIERWIDELIAESELWFEFISMSTISVYSFSSFWDWYHRLIHPSWLCWIWALVKSQSQWRQSQCCKVGTCQCKAWKLRRNPHNATLASNSHTRPYRTDQSDIGRLGIWRDLWSKRSDWWRSRASCIQGPWYEHVRNTNMLKNAE